MGAGVVGILRNEYEITFTDERLAEDSASDITDAQIVSAFIFSDPGRGVLEKLETSSFSPVTRPDTTRRR